MAIVGCRLIGAGSDIGTTGLVPRLFFCSPAPLFLHRRGRDSNPRYPKGHTGFRNQLDQPLRHLSTIGHAHFFPSGRYKYFTAKALFLQAGFKPGRKIRSLDDKHLIFGSFSRNIFRGRNRFRASNKMPLHSSGLFCVRRRWPNQNRPRRSIQLRLRRFCLVRLAGHKIARFRCDNSFC